jgi:hypothetical protein
MSTGGTMNEPQYYIDEIEKLVEFDVEFNVSSKAQAKQALADISQKQKQLRHLKSQIAQDEKEIRAQYQDRQASAGETTSAFASLFGKRKLAGSIRADAKRNVARQRDQQLAPYAKIKLWIDNIIVQVDGMKLQLKSYLQQPDEG